MVVQIVRLLKSVMTRIGFPLRITWPGGVWFTQPWIVRIKETLLIGSPIAMSVMTSPAQALLFIRPR